ncbi:pseudouridine synthase [Gleimia hominis]|uniref:RNA pseudouridylate synthase n=1 Tax=Gleimia hominis TaxID=595468 RepID=A0ABU3I8M5_9ACTO|nr:pseudouridine synthase [Gleimia hominis]MDT3766718.1 pseudouridine synthase [Gleimia hominis]
MTRTPPAYRGVYPTRVWHPRAHQIPLEGSVRDWFEQRYPTLSPTQLDQIFEGGWAVDRWGRPIPATAPAAVLARGVWLYRPIADEVRAPIEIPVVARGDGWLVADKPAGIATMPRGAYVARSLTVALRRQEHNDQIVAAHRLDRLTSGLVLCSTRASTRAALQRQFETRQVVKAYALRAPEFDLSAPHVLVRAIDSASVHQKYPVLRDLTEDGAFKKFWANSTVDTYWLEVRSHIERDPERMRMRVGTGASNATTLFAPLPQLSSKGTASYRAAETGAMLLRGAGVGTASYRVNSQETASNGQMPNHQIGAGEFAQYLAIPITGRTHQIRVHCAALGAPIGGDPLYGLGARGCTSGGGVEPGSSQPVEPGSSQRIYADEEPDRGPGLALRSIALGFADPSGKKEVIITG